MSTFPSIQTGILTQLPYGTMRRFREVTTAHETGQRYSYYYDAAPVAAWSLTFETITEAELTILRNFRESVWSWDFFTFVDPDSGTTYTKCRFGTDTFEVGYLGVGQYSLKLIIQEYR